MKSTVWSQNLWRRNTWSQRCSDPEWFTDGRRAPRHIQTFGIKMWIHGVLISSVGRIAQGWVWPVALCCVSSASLSSCFLSPLWTILSKSPQDSLCYCTFDCWLGEMYYTSWKTWQQGEGESKERSTVSGEFWNLTTHPLFVCLRSH